MKYSLMALLGALTLFLATPASANKAARMGAAPAPVTADEVEEFFEGEVGDEGDESQQAENHRKGCGKAVADAAKAAREPWGEMRNACAQLRSCKQTCRRSKREAKQDARGDKRDCKDECKNLKGKAKQDCNKSCTADFRDAKKDIRQGKRSCKTDCRGAFRTPQCVQARRKVWNEVLKGAASGFGPCSKAIEEFFTKDQ